MNPDVSQSDPAEGARDVIERELQRHPHGYERGDKQHSNDERPAIPETDDVKRIAPLSGTDRGGLGDKGWAEVPDSGIGGHPELEAAPRSGPDGGLNGPQPLIDPKTGGPRNDA